LVATSTLAGCASGTWSSETIQPKLELGVNQIARTSLQADITLRDMHLPRSFYLHNTAYFVVVSRDRLRFHVTLEHRWESLSDPSRWRVWLEDGRGNRYLPEGIDRRSVRSVTHTRRSRSNPNTVLYQTSVYRGDGDYVFYKRDIYRDDMRTLVLVMKRPGYEFRYRWSFVDTREDELRPGNQVAAHRSL